MLESELELELPTIPTLRFAPTQKQLILIELPLCRRFWDILDFRRAQDFGLDRGGPLGQPPPDCRRGV